MSEYITMRDCLKLDLKDAITQRDNLQDQRDFAMSEMERLRRERDEAREDAKRATYDAAQETIKVSTVKSHWIEACRERGEAREALREIQAADWKTAGELRGMARTALEAAK